jgi:hypothetical protein
VCDLETSRIGAPYIYDISHLRVKKYIIFRRQAEVHLQPNRNLCIITGRAFTNTPLPLYPQDKPGNHCTGGWELGDKANLAPVR